MVMLSPVPLATAACVVALWLALKARQRYMPFLLGVGIFMLCYTGLAVSLFPFIIPPGITIWQAAAAPDSQLFMLYGADPAACRSSSATPPIPITCSGKRPSTTPIIDLGKARNLQLLT